MRAAVYKGKQSFAVEDLPRPVPGPGEVLIRVKYSAVCGTDVHAFLYDAPPPGAVLGHEYSGRIAETGPGVTRWKKDDRVMGGGGEPPPGTQVPLRDHPRFDYRSMGPSINSVRSYAEYVINKDWEVIAIPEEVSDMEAALCEPAAVAVRAVRKSAARIGDSVAVLGAGPIGLFVIQAARAAGAAGVYVSEPSAARRRAALEVGADAVIDPTANDPVESVVELTGGLGPEVVYECASARPTLSQAFNMARRGGQVMLVAIAWEPTAVVPVEWMAREISLAASFGTDPRDWATVLSLIRDRKIDVSVMATDAGTIGLEGIQETFEALIKPTTQIQMVVDPWAPPPERSASNT